MEASVAIALTLFAVATSASAQTAGVGDEPSSFHILSAERTRLVCFSIKNVAGDDAPLLVMSKVDGNRYFESIVMTGKCLNFIGKKNIELRGTAIAEPVSVRVGPTRNALR